MVFHLLTFTNYFIPWPRESNSRTLSILGMFIGQSSYSQTLRLFQLQHPGSTKGGGFSHLLVKRSTQQAHAAAGRSQGSDSFSALGGRALLSAKSCTSFAKWEITNSRMSLFSEDACVRVSKPSSTMIFPHAAVLGDQDGPDTHL